MLDSVANKIAAMNRSPLRIALLHMKNHQIVVVAQSLTTCRVPQALGRMMLLGRTLGKRHPATIVPPSPHVAACRLRPKAMSSLPFTCRGCGPPAGISTSHRCWNGDIANATTARATDGAGGEPTVIA